MDVCIARKTESYLCTQVSSILGAYCTVQGAGMQCPRSNDVQGEFSGAAMGFSRRAAGQKGTRLD